MVGERSKYSLCVEHYELVSHRARDLGHLRQSNNRPFLVPSSHYCLLAVILYVIIKCKATRETMRTLTTLVLVVALTGYMPLKITAVEEDFRLGELRTTDEEETSALSSEALCLKELCLSFRDDFLRDMHAMGDNAEDILQILALKDKSLHDAQPVILKHVRGCDQIENYNEQFRIRFDQTKASLDRLDLEVYDANCRTPLRLMVAEGFCGLVV